MLAQEALRLLVYIFSGKKGIMLCPTLPRQFR